MKGLTQKESDQVAGIGRNKLFEVEKGLANMLIVHRIRVL
jgi:hypothetical protein